MSRRLDGLDLAAFIADGVHFGEPICVVALGIGIDGVKHPLATRRARRNATLVTDLITGRRERRLDVTWCAICVHRVCTGRQSFLQDAVSLDALRDATRLVAVKVVAGD